MIKTHVEGSPWTFDVECKEGCGAKYEITSDELKPDWFVYKPGQLQLTGFIFKCPNSKCQAHIKVDRRIVPNELWPAIKERV